jgi:hypothetical protein
MLEIAWRDLYRAAIVELDPVDQEIRVRAATNAINARESEDGVFSHERKELANALATLSRLKLCAAT